VWFIDYNIKVYFLSLQSIKFVQNFNFVELRSYTYNAHPVSALCKKLLVTQVAREFPTFFETGSYITVFTKAASWPY
jgi:hypothetical protein